MLKKLLTRITILTTLFLMGYFILISSETQSLRIEKNEAPEDSNPQQLGSGLGGNYHKYDASGNLVTSGTTPKAVRTVDEGFVLEMIEFNHRHQNKNYHIQADQLVTGEDQKRVMTANPGSVIVLEEENGIRIETPGPLIQEADGLISTDAETQFQIGSAKGRCKGIRYRSGEILELLDKVNFVDEGPGGSTRIDAEYLKVDQASGYGHVRGGVITLHSPLRQGAMTADRMELVFKDPAVLSLDLDRALLTGKPAGIFWNEVDMQAAYFDICFDETGKWPAEMDTANDAKFASQTQDQFQVSGNGGALKLLFQQGVPQKLTSMDSIRINGKKEGSPPFSLTGKQGVQASFQEGRIANTKIFGTPHFLYGSMSGISGGLHLLHNENKALFSQGAELWDDEQDIHIKGDEILLTGWDLNEREIVAYRFVELRYAEKTAQKILGKGETLKMKLPANAILLEGDPARITRLNETVEAPQIKANQVDGDHFNFQGSGQVHLTRVTDEGTFLVKAKKMDYVSQDNLIHFETVLEAKTPDDGSLSCGFLRVNLKTVGDKQTLHTITATKDVIFNGVVKHKDGDKPLLCMADRLDYDLVEGIAKFQGIDKDVVYKGPDGEAKIRQLIYDRKDGSLTGVPERRGTTTTTVPIKEPPSRDR